MKQVWPIPNGYPDDVPPVDEMFQLALSELISNLRSNTRSLGEAINQDCTPEDLSFIADGLESSAAAMRKIHNMIKQYEASKEPKGE